MEGSSEKDGEERERARCEVRESEGRIEREMRMWGKR